MHCERSKSREDSLLCGLTSAVTLSFIDLIVAEKLICWFLNESTKPCLFVPMLAYLRNLLSIVWMRHVFEPHLVQSMHAD